MKSLVIKELKQHVGERVAVRGWLHKRRNMGGLVFLVVRDRSGVVQIVAQAGAETEKLQGLQNGTVVQIEAVVKEEARAEGGVELHEPAITVISAVTDVMPVEIDKPISHKSENFDTLFDNRPITLRNRDEQAIFKIQAGVGRAFRRFFEERDFTEVHTPKLLAGATEGGAEVFKTDYFGKLATLAQSPQFYKQMMVGVFERVFEIGPVYRAEPSVTTRHMSEYISLDAEVGFITFEELQQLLSDLLNFMVDSVWKECPAELERLKAIKPKLTKTFPSVPMAEVHKMYAADTGEEITDEKDLTPAEERWLSQYALKEFGSEAVFVTEWPASDMKFYHYADRERPEMAVRADLIFRGVEIVTTSMREHEYDRLVKQLKELAGGDPESPGFKPFVSIFKYGMPPHGGFGMGLERTTQEIIGLSNVKEATLFPRDTKRLAP